MNNRLDEIFKQAGPQQDRVAIVIDGCFDCQICGETVDEAHYYPPKGLAWTCSNKHLSRADEFVLPG